uniref:Uncharacterized protein n=1 Tax=Anguilla anguilla TaxID=7936 RepID=A0A0E9SYN9_ANGAN
MGWCSSTIWTLCVHVPGWEDKGLDLAYYCLSPSPITACCTPQQHTCGMRASKLWHNFVYGFSEISER